MSDERHFSAAVRPAVTGVSVSHVTSDGGAFMRTHSTMREARVAYSLLRTDPTTAYAQITRDDEVMEQFVRPLTAQVMA